ncbi:uncharacterized protein LOC122665578 [Telopea speciosissima]|uniref:uncharacterized protein LOC122665578 n=1 Tax=Telopea speciosissima TaxID=54955 RepID=UPI001CC36800|nr:uncharacterized protein LOC122665578 [Telopea speciosissima]
MYLEPCRRLDRKAMMVIGASSGLDREFCLDLAKAGCFIIASNHRKDRLVSLCNEMNQLISISSSLDSNSEPRPNRAVVVEFDVRAKELAIDVYVHRTYTGKSDIPSRSENFAYELFVKMFTLPFVSSLYLSRSFILY